jgi:cytochrome c556
MSRRIAVVVILIAALFAATTIFAQQRPYNQIMKDVQTTFASLKKGLDASGVAGAAAAPAGRGAAPAAEEGGGGRGGRGAAAPANWDPAVRDAAAQDAAKLQGLFKETEAFWAKFETHDAMDFAKSAQDGAEQVAAAAKANDPRKAQAAYAAIQKNCGTCHFSHREETGKGFLIKP